MPLRELGFGDERSVCRRGHRLQNDSHDLIRRGDQRRVIDSAASRFCAHAFGHRMLRLWIDHAVFLRHQEPRRFRFPSRLGRRFLNARQSNRPLCSCQNRNRVGGGILRERIAKAVFRHPDEAVGGGRQLRGFRVRLASIKHVTDGLALIGRQRGDVHERLYQMTPPA